ncbi:sigma-70 family RNA polymerase sigma factor [Glycocaulis sp.]|uniref:sigma-70 family RNA polymerase sigma factor n=1 Tax=Glycocaulis sp. TaxID=1969725 RepID=UPI0025B7C1F5|nr:sigma-70 family RNA polymerase sigma factor [Glycocaulis sp.]MCH8521430.1 sigma-70 family RNA polymerase sigma factor [Glycocaulis sp.]
MTSEADAKLRALMVLAQAGDRAAYRSVLDIARAQLAIYFRYRLKEDPASADDLVQETLIAIHTKRATYDARHPFMPWLYAIARYKLIDHYRRYRVRRTEPEEAAGDIADETDDTRAAMARLDLETLLARLPAGQAEAIRRTKLNGQSVSETASAMNISESLVKVNVHRGLKAAASLVGLKQADRS